MQKRNAIVAKDGSRPKPLKTRSGLTTQVLGPKEWIVKADSYSIYIGLTQRPLSSSFLGLLYRIININHKKELVRGLWVM